MKISYLNIVFTLLCIFFKAQNYDTRSRDPFLSKLLDKEFPITEFSDLNSKQINLKHYYDKPTLINLWFTTCAPCIEEMPFLNRLQNNHLQKVNFIAITFDSIEKILKFKTKHNFNFSQFIVEYKKLEKVGIIKYPLSFVLDKNGKVIRIFGGINEDNIVELENVLENLE